MKKLLLFCSIALFAGACSDHINDPAPSACKLSSSPSVTKVTYNNSGQVDDLTIESYYDTTKVLVISMFSYDATGKLAKTVYTVNGKPNSEETYTYTDGRITQVSFSGPNSPTGINNISYDAAGRFSRYTVEVAGNLQYTQTYTYNADGVLTEQLVTGPQGDVLYQTVVKPVGSAKSPDGLLIQKGLPYLLPTGTPLVMAEGGVGTVTEFYSADASGKLVLVGSQKVSALKTNARGYLTEYTTTDGDGNYPTTGTYTLTDCP